MAVAPFAYQICLADLWVALDGTAWLVPMREGVASSPLS